MTSWNSPGPGFIRWPGGPYANGLIRSPLSPWLPYLRYSMAWRATVSTTERRALPSDDVAAELLELLIVFGGNEGGKLVNPGLGAEWLQAACADESAVGARRQMQRLSVQTRCEVRGGTK